MTAFRILRYKWAANHWIRWCRQRMNKNMTAHVLKPGTTVVNVIGLNKRFKCINFTGGKRYILYFLCARLFFALKISSEFVKEPKWINLRPSSDNSSSFISFISVFYMELTPQLQHRGWNWLTLSSSRFKGSTSP